VVVDGDVQELGADAFDTVAAVSGDAVRGSLDAYQAFDIEVQQVAWSSVLVTNHGRLRFQIADPMELEPAQDAADRGRTQTQLLGDPNAGPALAAKRFDLPDQLLRSAARAAVRAAGPVAEASPTLPPEALDPVRGSLPAELELGPGLLQAQPALHNSTGKFFSLIKKSFAMMVIVHSVS
jgi:hypothetical protein